MVARIIFISFFAVVSVPSFAQCLTDFQKLLPDRTPAYNETFGYVVDTYDDIVVVGAHTSDSLGYTSAGLVYLYKKNGSTWELIGILKPSDPSAGLQFGHNVKITENYIFISSFKAGSSLYIFKKPATGWTTAVETVKLNPAGTTGFGRTLALSEDEQTLVVSDMTYPVSNGALFVYHKLPTEEWSTSMTPQVILNPDKDNGVILFASEALAIVNGKIACVSSPIFTAASGAIYIFSDASGTYSNYQLEAKITNNTGSSGYGPGFQFTPEGIFKYRGNIVFYETPASGTWSDVAPSCEFVIDPVDGIAIAAGFANYRVSGGKLVLSVKLTDGSSRMLLYSKTGASWCDGVSREVVFTEPPPAAGGSTLFARSLGAYNGTQIVNSWKSSLEAGSPTAVAVGIYTLQPDNTWLARTVFRSKRNAENYRQGTALWSSGDFLFTGAVNERILDRQPRGAVYIFKKESGLWSKVNKITMPPMQDSDNGFGRFITGYGDYVALSSFAYSPGKIFIYKGSGGDFSAPVLWQSLDMPPEKYVDSYAAPVMNDQWLIVPVGTNAPSVGPKVGLFLFRRDATDHWVYSHDMELDNMTIFFKSPPTLAIEGNTLIASNGYDKVFVLEYDESVATWQNYYTLHASDPDSDPFIGSITINGSFFGSALAIHDGKIFVGAYGKNEGSKNDVGAIYVYLRNPDGTWTSGTESVKISPATITAGTNFGVSIAVLNNTLITGAVNDANPGKVFIVQAKDYFWNNTIQLLELTGDTFAPDRFGHTVALDGDDFFIGATIENNDAGLSAGTVYVTVPPPLVKLQPPVCNTADPYDFLGYPFNGTWSGPGITDAAAGTFDPVLAGVGTHEITYTTPNCFYVGRLEIDVKSGPVAEPVTDLEHTLCNEGRTSVTLGVDTESNVSYRWYFRENDHEGYVSLPEASSSMVVSSTKPGQYKIEAVNNDCAITRLFKVALESLTLTLAPQDKICDEEIGAVSLSASLAGGLWTSNGAFPDDYIDLGTNVLAISDLSDGTYTLEYQYESDAGCLYDASQSLVIDRLQMPTLKSSGELCAGTLTLSLEGVDPLSTVQWYQGNSPEPVGDQSFLRIKEAGSYVARVLKYTCQVETEAAVVATKKDSLFVPNVFTPNGDSYNDCFEVVSENLADFHLSIVNRYGMLVFKTNDPGFKWYAKDISTGVYFYHATYKDCTNEQKEIKGWVHKLN